MAHCKIYGMSTFLAENIKYLVHMRQRMHDDKRLGCCLGAGVSADFKIPSWKELIQRIAEHPQVQGRELLKVSESLTAQSQFLYQRFLQFFPDYKRDAEDDVVRNRRVGMAWLRIVHECLYREADVADNDLKAHPYLYSLVPLIKESAMTINYNFDDSVERTLYLYNKETNSVADDKGFEVVWQPSSQFRRNSGVIYHPNGFLPLQTIDGFSEQLVFMEQEFADQLVDVSAGHYASLLNHFSKNTIIFLGLSLSDANLKHLLRVSARSNPGNFHYHIHWCSHEKPTEQEQDAIRKANFQIYNLVTLFLTTAEVKELTQLLVASNEEFRAICDAEPHGLQTEYRYYLTGTVGSGKTTVLEQIRSLRTFDEWVDRRHPLLGKPHSDLSEPERKDVDEWINKQFRKKNRRVTSDTHTLALVDRSPLDPLYFVKDKRGEASRAKELLEWMVPAKGSITQIASGHLIVLNCDSRVLQLRLASRDKTYTQEQLDPQAKTINEMWVGHQTSVINTTNMTSSQVVSKVLETILFEEYQPIDFHDACFLKLEKAA